ALHAPALARQRRLRRPRARGSAQPVRRPRRPRRAEQRERCPGQSGESRRPGQSRESRRPGQSRESRRPGQRRERSETRRALESLQRRQSGESLHRRQSREAGRRRERRHRRERSRARERRERRGHAAPGLTSSRRESGRALMAVAAGRPTERKQPENPLTAGLERQPVPPTTLVIFGATGDLARRKLLPALYNLAHDGALPERFYLIGVSRKEKAHEDYRRECEEAIERFSRRKPDPDVLKGLLENVRYVPGTFDDDSVYKALGDCMDASEKDAGEPLNRAFYLSTAPAFFPVIVGKLGESKLSEHED